MPVLSGVLHPEEQTGTEWRMQMRKKTGSFLAMTLVLGLTMTGCVKTPGQALVAQKNNERLEEIAREKPQEGSALKGIAESTASTYDFNYKSEDGKVSILADHVPVTLPDKDTIPMYHVSCGEIPQSVADKAYAYFFPDGGYTFTGTDVTKSEIDKRILETQQTIANYKDDDTISEEEREQIIQTNEEILKSLEEDKKTAPEESTLKAVPKDSAYTDGSYETIGGSVGVKELDVSSKDHKKGLYIVSADASTSVTSSLSYSDQNAWNYFPDSGTPAAECSDEERQKIGISQDDATSIVKQFIAALGMNWEIHDTFCVQGYHVKENGEDGETIPSDDYTAYQFILAQSIDGIQSAVTSSNYLPEDDASVTWLYEQISIIVEPGGIVSVNWNYPLTVEDTVSDNVGIISFDEAKDVFENMMPLVAKGDLEQYDDENLETTGKLTVSDVRLGLMRVRDSGDKLTGLMTPVWLFYGEYSRSSHYLKSSEELGYEAEDHTITEEQPWILLAVNAVDGSVIDIKAGY